MSVGNWGGSAAGGGLEFQAAASALCMVHMARGTSLGWSAAANDAPLSVSAETGGAGDDISLTLTDGSVLEVQAKRRLRADLELWNSLIALCRRAHEIPAFYGVLLVGPTSSVVIREQLARDIIRIGQGRTDDLSALAVMLTTKLSEASIPLSACDRVRIHTVHLLEQDGASVQSALAHLAHITTQPAQAWEHLKAQGLRLIRLRGRQDVGSVSKIILGLLANASGPLAPAIIARQLLDWTLKKTRTFAIPAVDKEFSLDDDWIELEAHGREKHEVSLGTLEEALARYHEGPPQAGPGRERNKFSAESLGYFVRQCVVVAGPGMGKTQLLRRIARMLAHKNEPSLLVRLRPLAERMRKGETFLDAVLHIGLDAFSLRPADIRMLGMQNLTLLLDGLDESGNEQEEIAKAAVALAASHPRCRIVFSTRPIGYETSVLSAWRHYDLIPIESSNAKRFVEHLVKAGMAEENIKVNEATAAATSHLDSTRDHRLSAKSPLLIALLASLALNEVIASATREGLYGQLFKLIERMTKVKQETVTVTPTVLNAFLHHLGWELTAQPYADTERVLAACARRLAVDLDVPALRAKSLCDEAIAFWENAGIVERVRFKVSEALTFVHKTFGEYAAAQFVLSRGPREQAQLLTVIEPADQWNEVAVFLAALGLGPDLVQLALACEHKGSSEIARLLRWTRHSKNLLESDLAEKVLQLAWTVVAGSHSGQALRTGANLVAALGKLPSAAPHAHAFCTHPQWWTALTGWTCFVQINPKLLEFEALLAFMDSYADGADTRRVGGGFELYNPVRQLWEELLLSSAREAVRRGIGVKEKKFIDRLEQSLGARSMGFVSEFTHILKEVGINAAASGNVDLLSKYLSPDYLERARQDARALLDAIGEASAENAPSASPPWLHLSAFWYGTGLMTMELSAALLAAGASGGNEARQIIKLAARLSSYDYGQLIAEAQAKIREIDGADGLSRNFDGVLSVDAPINWGGHRDSSARPVITKALLHPSRWIVYLAANLAEQVLTAADAAELVPHVLAKSNGLGMAAAAEIALHFLGEEQARDLMIARLKQPLNSGCQHLFEYLAKVWTPRFDDQAGEILISALSFDPRSAKAALCLARACSGPRRREFIPMLRQAYDYWLKNEGPYPIEGGFIPESPRGDILDLLIEEGASSQDELFAAAKDRRSEVSQSAKDALLTVLSTSEAARNELVQRIQAGELLENVLNACLRSRTPFGKQDIQSIAGLLESSSPRIRHAAVGILECQYLPAGEIRKWAEKLLHDPYQELRDKGHERLAAVASGPSGGMR